MKRYLKTPEEVTTALKEGKVVLDRTGNKYKSINGFIVVSYISGGWGLNPFIGNGEGIYVDEPETIKLEVGKFYRNRDGQKVIILADACKPKAYPYFVAEIGKWTMPYTVRKNGFIYEKGANAWDIIAPWEE